MTRALLCLPILIACGCAGFNPIRGRAVENVDPSLLASAKPRTAARTIDLGLLSQPRPNAHVVDRGDVLGIYVEGVLGDDEKGPPVTAPIQLDASGLTTVVRPAPEIGYPITVAHDGTITLPQKPPINVRGLTLAEVRAELRNVFVGDEGTLQDGQEKIVVTLQKPRTVRVTVVRKDREEEPQFLQPPDYRRVEDGRGSGVTVELPVYENDVLHALVASGGMPSQDGENAVRVVRAGGLWRGLGPVEGTCPGWSMSAGSPVPAFGHSVTSTGQSDIVLTSAVTGHSFGGHSFGGKRPTPARTPPTVVGPQPSLTVRSPAFDAATPPVVSTFTPPLSTGGCDAGTCDGLTCGPSSSGRGCKPALFGNGKFRRDRGTAAPCNNHSRGFPPQSIVTTSCDMTVDNPSVRFIPLTLLPGECAPFDRCDVLLGDGDIVFVESRAKEFFYTAGLLGGGKYPLPRDEDLDLLDAIALVDSQRRVVPTRAVGGVSSLNQDVTVGASRVIVYRDSPSGKKVPIRLNLNEIKRNPSKSILIRPGDRIFLQYTRLEAVAAGFERHFLDGTVLGVASGVTFGD